MKSCEFLTVLKNFPSILNGDGSKPPTPGIPTVINKTFTSISLKWDSVQNTSGSAVYLIEIAFTGERSRFSPSYSTEVNSPDIKNTVAIVGRFVVSDHFSHITPSLYFLVFLLHWQASSFSFSFPFSFLFCVVVFYCFTYLFSSSSCYLFYFIFISCSSSYSFIHQHVIFLLLHSGLRQSTGYTQI